MSFGVGLGDIALILQTCIDIYERFKIADETIINARQRVQTIHGYVETVVKGLNKKYGGPNKYPKSQICLLHVQRIKGTGREIEQIFIKYEKVVDKPNFVLAACSKAIYTFGGSTSSLQKLIKDLETQRADLHYQFDVENIVDNLPGPEVTMQSISRSLQDPPDVSILFVDSGNIGRSVVAQAYAKLVAQWTTRTKGKWRIKTIHAAGFDIKNQCGLLDVRGQLPGKLHDGKQSPSSTAVSALFDKPTFNYPFKASIRDEIIKGVSRGLGRSTFATYDYIIVFTLKTLWDIQKLAYETRKKHPELAPPGKIRYFVLGEHSKSKDTNIWGPKPGQTDQQKKEFWDRTVANIKVSFKNWLTAELDWKQPAKGAAVS